jgi:hypothetical protein
MVSNARASPIVGQESITETAPLIQRMVVKNEIFGEHHLFQATLWTLSA